MICNKCNHNLPDDSVFCQYCGNKIEKVEVIEGAEFDNNTAEFFAELNDPNITPGEALRTILDYHASATAEAAAANSVDQPGDEKGDDFGLTPENPIFTLAAKSVDGEHEYLDQLYTENGEKIKYKRRGSTSATGVHGITDVYNTYLPSGELYKTIYINMYGAESSKNAPVGFVFFTDKLEEVKNVLNGDNKTDEYGESIDSRSKQPKNVANFCSVCGTKCVSGASFCFDCGASLHTKPRQNNKNNHSNSSKVLVIINFAFNVCLALYTCFAFLAVALLRINVDVSHKASLQYSSLRKEYYVSNTGPSVRSYIRFDETFVILATIIAVAILTLAVISFILELKKHNNSDEKFWTSILRLVVSAVVTTTTIFLLCCNNFVI